MFISLLKIGFFIFSLQSSSFNMLKRVVSDQLMTATVLVDEFTKWTNLFRYIGSTSNCLYFVSFLEELNDRNPMR